MAVGIKKIGELTLNELHDICKCNDCCGTECPLYHMWSVCDAAHIISDETRDQLIVDVVDIKEESVVQPKKNDSDSNLEANLEPETVVEIGQALVDICREQKVKETENLAFGYEYKGNIGKADTETNRIEECISPNTSIDGMYDWGTEIDSEYGKILEINKGLRGRIKALERYNDKLLNYIKKLEDSIVSSFSIVYDYSPIESYGYGYTKDEDM